MAGWLPPGSGLRTPVARSSPQRSGTVKLYLDASQRLLAAIKAEKDPAAKRALKQKYKAVQERLGQFRTEDDAVAAGVAAPRSAPRSMASIMRGDGDGDSIASASLSFVSSSDSDGEDHAGRPADGRVIPTAAELAREVDELRRRPGATGRLRDLSRLIRQRHPRWKLRTHMLAAALSGYDATDGSPMRPPAPP